MSPSFNSVLAPSSEVKRHSVVATTKESRVPLPRISRRRFLQASLAAAGWAWSGLPLHGAISYENLRTDDYLGPVQVLTQLSGKPFTEGPAADRDGNLYFTNVPVNQILKWEVSEKRLSVFRSDSNEANGLLFDREGRLLACE